MTFWIELAVAILLLIGGFFVLVGSVGLSRLPDFYTRLHAVGTVDTMGLFFTMSGLILYLLQDFTLANVMAGLKISLIVVFFFIASPTATHAIVDAGIRGGGEPWKKRKKEGDNL